MKKASCLLSAFLVAGFFSTAWVLLTGKGFGSFLGLLSIIVAGFGIIAVALRQVEPNGFNFVRDRVEQLKQEGRNAYLRGLPEEANPYASVDAELWCEGYRNAKASKSDANCSRD